ncbi:MAG TPA: sigma-70 family RNA polymerase sigma factor [Gemmataceae bacterium]|nr:sigma-70 family RNA polymerase sigma factor [Gemmataceae bacterium]
MELPHANTVLPYIRKLAAAETVHQQSDCELLQGFVADRDDEAFAALMRRHGGIVMNVCRSVLRSPHDAEDVFQATFLVLAQKAVSIREYGSLASWLHGVAYRLACKHRSRESRRRAMEGCAAIPEAPRMDDMTWRELREVLHQEISLLSEKYRTPLLLCYWAGKTQEEAAALLGWPLGTLKTRLGKARECLRGRLGQRGFTLAVPLLATMLSQESTGAGVPESLVRASVAAARLVAAAKSASLSGISAEVVSLLRESFPAMLAAKLKWLMLLICTAGSLAIYGAFVVQGLPPEPTAHDTAEHKAQPGALSRDDRFGDPLPEGAVARLGTIRFRNEAHVSRFVLAADDLTIATMAGKTVSLWETKTGRPRSRITLPVDLDSLAFSPNGRMLAVGGRDCIFRLIDSSSGKEIRQFVGHESTIDRRTNNGVSGVVFLPHGRSLVTWGSDKTIRLWEIDTGKEIRRFETADWKLWTVELSPDGKLLAAASAKANQHAAEIWNAETGKLIHHLPCSEQPAHVAFSPDNQRLAATMFESGRPGRVVLWAVATGKEIVTLQGAENSTFSLAFSPDGSSMATGGIDQTIRIWDLANGKEGRKIGPLGSVVGQVAFTQDGKCLISSGGLGNLIRLWDLTTGKELLALNAPKTSIASIAYSADGKRLASASEKTIWVWDVASTKLQHKLEGHAGYVSSLTFSKDGKSLLSASQDGTIRLWDCALGKEQRCIKTSNSRGQMAISPDGTKLAWNSLDLPETIALFDIKTGKELSQLAIEPEQPGGRSSIFSLAFSPDSRSLIASSGTHLRLLGWDLATGKERALPGKHDGGLNCARFSPDGRSVAVASMGGSVYLWEMATGQGRLVVKDAGYTTTLAFSPDGRCLALGNDGSHSLWTSEKNLVSSGFENRTQVRLLDLTNSKIIHTFKGHAGPTDVLVFSPDGMSLASGSRDTTVLVWDVAPYTRRASAQAEPLQAADLERLWSDLAGDASKAYRSIVILAAAPSQTVAYFKGLLHPITTPNSEVVSGLVKQLDSSRFSEREKALVELNKLADGAEPILRRALAAKQGPEVQRRLEQILRALDLTNPGSHRLRTLRALEILERIGDAQATDLLLRLAGGAPDAWLSKEAQASLLRLNHRSISHGPSDLHGP